MSNTLFDVLGILVAFSTVMLLLSLVVTGLVQGTQSIFRIRARNLLHGVSSLLADDTASGKRMAPNEAKERAARVLNHPLIASVDRVPEPNSRARRVMGPKVTWATPEQLAKAVVKDDADRGISRGEKAASEVRSSAVEPTRGAAAAIASSDAADSPDPALVTAIRAVEPAWSKRFEFIAKLIALFWALVVAIAFQVSSPELFSTLVHDPVARQAIIDRRNEALGIAKDSGAVDLDLKSDKALDKLAAKYPGHKPEIDQAGNDGESNKDLVAQLDAVLQPSSDRLEILQCYAALLDNQSCDRDIQTAVSAGLSATDELATFGIGLWSKHANYYFTAKEIHFGNIIGVLITAMFLSFGAPFWFNLLKNLSALRDARSARDKEEKGAGK